MQLGLDDQSEDGTLKNFFLRDISCVGLPQSETEWKKKMREKKNERKKEEKKLATNKTKQNGVYR